ALMLVISLVHATTLVASIGWMEQALPISLFALSRSCLWRAVIATQLPSCANSLAIAKPIPRLPPEIRTTFPARSRSMWAANLFRNQAIVAADTFHVLAVGRPSCLQDEIAVIFCRPQQGKHLRKIGCPMTQGNRRSVQNSVFDVDI